MSDTTRENSEIEQPAAAAPANDAARASANDTEPRTEEAPTPEEVAELKDRLLRTLADMENLRRRTQREIEDARKFAITGFARDLLEVADNLSRALASVPPEAREANEFVKNLVLGVEMTGRSLLNAFEKHQVRKVEPQKGDKFDHKLHQAMFEVPTNAQPPGTIAEVVQAGYVIADRLLRPALVGVAKAAPQADTAADEETTEPGVRVDTVA
ncbi:nucleotide exchange factor GrpE [Benzoatithermus flavus]|uniref:Protein GrpE n=1 Tax=Benzoatithermus flavus TaxID=3108223 RepID=A0ABU8XTL0_9PROT